MGFRALIQHNFWLKLFSLLLATLAWFVIQLETERDLQFGQRLLPGLDRRESLKVAVTVLTQPGDSRIFKVKPEFAIVTVAAEGAVLREISRKNVKAYVDLTEATPAPDMEYLVKLHVPSGVSILNWSPFSVRVEQLSP